MPHSVAVFTKQIEPIEGSYGVFKFSVQLAPWLRSLVPFSSELDQKMIGIHSLRLASYYNNTSNTWAARVVGSTLLAEFTHTQVNGMAPDDYILDVLMPHSNEKGENKTVEERDGVNPGDAMVVVDLDRGLDVEIQEMTSIFDTCTPTFTLRFSVDVSFIPRGDDSSDTEYHSA